MEISCDICNIYINSVWIKRNQSEWVEGIKSQKDQIGGSRTKLYCSKLLGKCRYSQKPAVVIVGNGSKLEFCLYFIVKITYVDEILYVWRCYQVTNMLGLCLLIYRLHFLTLSFFKIAHKRLLYLVYCCCHSGKWVKTGVFIYLFIFKVDRF